VKTQNVSTIPAPSLNSLLLYPSKTTFIVSLAASDSVSFRRDSLESDLQDHTRVSVHTFTPDPSDEPKLEKVGEWRVDGCVGGVSCHKHDNGGSRDFEINRV